MIPFDPLKIRVDITEEALEPSRPAFPLDGASGAVVDFWGVVRLREGESTISALKYEAYLPMALQEFNRIAEELEHEHPIHELEVLHRVGVVPIGEPSLYVRVCAQHRAEALAFTKRLIDEMKQRVPIWKKAVM